MMLDAETPQDIFTNNSETNTTRAQDWTDVYEAVRWIQLIMALLSVLGSGSIIVCVMLQRLSRTPELQPLFLLSVSDLLLALCWLIGAALYSERCNILNTLCYHLHIIEEILYMASFFYTLNYVWNLFTCIREKYITCMTGYPGRFSNRVSTAGKITALLSCLFPVLLMTPVFAVADISRCQANFSEPYRCLLMHTGAVFSVSHHHRQVGPCSAIRTYCISIFLTSFLLTLIGIMVLMGKARRIYRRVVSCNGYLGNQQRASFRVMDWRMILYPVIFIFCWGPAVVLAVLLLVAPSGSHGKIGVTLYILQALTSASQGFLNCLVYGWTRGSLRGVSRTVLCRDTDTQTPLLRSQKTRGYQSTRTTG
ncbi:transmembrane protein 116 [Sphaeramia orbicularis]|uniref:G-protein coupled receptors family 1 profile domain-containing protein n=1 Tax=Sphaeramia orbicularis TaxID=375764 RepID=A0A673A9W5_9TELE|nr:transmembrane protein 116 [Sphaeramia orbicularis]